MFKKQKIWLLLILASIVWFDLSPLGEQYFNVDDEDIYTINGVEWVNLDIELEQDSFSIAVYEDSHLVRRKASNGNKDVIIASQTLDVDYFAFFLPINTARGGLDKDSKPIYFDLQDWLYLNYLF